jgi:hypothetical protein
MWVEAAGNRTLPVLGDRRSRDSHQLWLTNPAREPALGRDALGRRVEHVNDLLDTTTRYYYDGVNELVEYDGAGSRSRYYVHGVSYVDERLMMYHDGHEVPYYYAIDRMYDVVGLVDYCGSIIERYCYDSYGRPLIRESAGRGDSDNDTDLDMTDQNAVLAGGFDPRMDVSEDGVRNITDWVALLSKRSNWYPATSPTVAQAFSDVDNPYMFQGVPHFALDTAADGTQPVLPLNHHRARFSDPVTGRWSARDPLYYNRDVIGLDQVVALRYAWMWFMDEGEHRPEPSPEALLEIAREGQANRDGSNLFLAFRNTPVDRHDPLGLWLCIPGSTVNSCMVNSPALGWILYDVGLGHDGGYKVCMWKSSGGSCLGNCICIDICGDPKSWSCKVKPDYEVTYCPLMNSCYDYQPAQDPTIDCGC